MCKRPMELADTAEMMMSEELQGTIQSRVRSGCYSPSEIKGHA